MEGEAAAPSRRGLRGRTVSGERPLGARAEPVAASAEIPGAGSRGAGRILSPLKDLLAQGLTPERLALSLAVGLVCGLFPIIGATTLLSVGAGFALRLNHPAVQLVNYLVYPLQVPLILAFVRLGEILARAPAMPFSPLLLVARFREDPVRFLEQFGLTGLHGILGWSVVAPAILAVGFFGTLPLLRRLHAALHHARADTPLASRPSSR